jgi:hypothetical protein
LIQFERKNPEQGGATTGGKKQPNLLALFLAAGGHLMIAGQHPVSMVVNPSIAGGLRYPIIFQYELEGDQEGRPDIEDPPGNQSFAFKDLCVDVMDFAITGYSRWRTQDLNCPVTTLRHVLPTGKRDHGMRAGIPLDPNFPRIELRPETAGVNKAHQPSEAGLSVEVYNPQYFFDACQFTPSHSRACFQPIFGLECLDSSEPTFGQPVAFWTTVYQDRIAEVPGAVQARSVVYGFPPVMFKPAQVKPGIEHILFDEWQLEKLQ